MTQPNIYLTNEVHWNLHGTNTIGIFIIVDRQHDNFAFNRDARVKISKKKRRKEIPSYRYNQREKPFWAANTIFTFTIISCVGYNADVCAFEN